MYNQRLLSLRQVIVSCTKFCPNGTKYPKYCSKFGLAFGFQPAKQVLRVHLHQAAMLSSSASDKKLLTVFRKEAPVKVLSSAEIKVPFNVQLLALDAQKNYHLNHVEVKLDAEVAQEETEESLKDTYEIDFVTENDKLILKGNLTETGKQKYDNFSPFVCTVEIPMQCNIDVEVPGLNSVSANDLEANNLRIQTEKGTIHCKKLKCDRIELDSKEGDVLSVGVMQGNIDIKTRGEGKVSGMRFQGSDVNISTERGMVDMSAIYATKSHISSISGNMNLENYHGNGIVKIEEGNLKISGLDGSLQAEVAKGDIEVQVSRLEGLHIAAKNGNVEVKVPVELAGRLELEGKSIEVDKRLGVQVEYQIKKGQKSLSGFLGAGKGPLIMIVAPKGSIRVSIQDWLAGLELGGVIPEFSHKKESHEPQPMGR